MIHQIYILCLLAITVLVLVYYYMLESEHKKELEKINRLEIENKREQQQLEMIRSETVPCQAGSFMDPRSCYYNSGYTCTWNELAKRCDQKA